MKRLLGGFLLGLAAAVLSAALAQPVGFPWNPTFGIVTADTVNAVDVNATGDIDAAGDVDGDNATFTGTLTANSVPVPRIYMASDTSPTCASIDYESPSGWMTCSNVGTGLMRFTHNWGDENYTCTANGTASGVIVRTIAVADNYVTLTTVDSSGAATNGGTEIICFRP